MDEKTNDVDDDETDFSTRTENRVARDLVVVLIVALNQRALGEDEIEREHGQGERGEEAHPNENRVGFDHAAVSNHRTDESEERDDGDDSENDTGDDETNPSTRRDFNMCVVDEIWSCIDGVDEPEECTSAKSATDERQERGDENGSPNGNAATEVSTSAHRVLVRNSLVR